MKRWNTDTCSRLQENIKHLPTYKKLRTTRTKCIMTMVFRAKITKVQSWVENHYNINAYTMVRDAKDVYIEVKDEDEAELLESINRKQEELLLLKSQWYEKFDNE